MTREITLFNHPINDPKILTNPEDLDSILEQISDLDNQVFDLSTMEGIEELKEVKKKATKWIKDLKEKCNPLEAEGRKVSDARSKITVSLTGKNSGISNKLNPAIEAEKKLDYINILIVTPIRDINTCNMRLQEAKSLEDFNWLAYKDQANRLIAELTLEAESRKGELEIIAKAKQDELNKEREEREKIIARESVKKAVKELEDKFKKEAEEKKLAEQAKVNADNRAKEAERLKADDVEHRRKIHNELMKSFSEWHSSRGQNDIGYFKDLIKAIANNKIPHLYIKY